MDAVDQTPSRSDAEAHDALRHDSATIALWHALAVDRQPRDERSERLRTMRLICGEDERV